MLKNVEKHAILSVEKTYKINVKKTMKNIDFSDAKKHKKIRCKKHLEKTAKLRVKKTHTNE